MGQKLMKWRLGFRDKHEICLNFTILEQCPCPDYLTEEESQMWIDNLIAEGHLQRRDNMGAMYPPSEEEIVNSPERVFGTAVQMPNTTDSSSRAWFFYVTSSSAARWLAIDGLVQLKGEKAGFGSFLRGSNCCVRCACRAIRTKSFVLL